MFKFRKQTYFDRIKNWQKRALIELYLSIADDQLLRIREMGGTESEAEEALYQSVVLAWEFIHRGIITNNDELHELLQIYVLYFWVKEKNDITALKSIDSLQRSLLDKHFYKLDTYRKSAMYKLYDRSFFQLSKTGQSILSAYYFDNRSYKEIAENLKFSTSLSAREKKENCYTAILNKNTKGDAELHWSDDLDIVDLYLRGFLSKKQSEPLLRHMESCIYCIENLNKHEIIQTVICENARNDLINYIEINLLIVKKQLKKSTLNWNKKWIGYGGIGLILTFLLMFYPRLILDPIAIIVKGATGLFSDEKGVSTLKTDDHVKEEQYTKGVETRENDSPHLSGKPNEFLDNIDEMTAFSPEEMKRFEHENLKKIRLVSKEEKRSNSKETEPIRLDPRFHFISLKPEDSMAFPEEIKVKLIIEANQLNEVVFYAHPSTFQNYEPKLFEYKSSYFIMFHTTVYVKSSSAKNLFTKIPSEE